VNSNNNQQYCARDVRVWVLTDGKAGDDVQCLAVARALAPAFEKRVVNPRAPFTWIMPWGGIDPRDHHENDHSPIKPPFPDVVIASGRRAIAYALRVKAQSEGKALAVILKDPRIDQKKADFIWAPEHDNVRGPNVMTTLTSPHGLSDKLETARRQPVAAIAALGKPMLGVLLGGPGGGAQYDAKTTTDLAAKITQAGKAYASIAVAPSRRTPANMVRAISCEIVHSSVFVWRGEGTNPYTDILANADALIVTADSHNMMSEALATSVGVYAFRPPGLAQKLSWFSDQMETSGAIKRFTGNAAPFARDPIDATAKIVAAIREKLAL